MQVLQKWSYLIFSLHFWTFNQKTKTNVRGSIQKRNVTNCGKRSLFSWPPPPPPSPCGLFPQFVTFFLGSLPSGFWFNPHLNLLNFFSHVFRKKGSLFMTCFSTWPFRCSHGSCLQQIARKCEFNPSFNLWDNSPQVRIHE